MVVSLAVGRQDRTAPLTVRQAGLIQRSVDHFRLHGFDKVWADFSRPNPKDSRNRREVKGAGRFRDRDGRAIMPRTDHPRSTTMPKLVIAVILALLAQSVQAEDRPSPAKPGAEKRPARIWNRTGPLDNTPKHVTDAYPLSDQENKSGWVKFEPMSDEFEGKKLDRNKWMVGMTWWKGRQPALFSEKNVTVSDGKLHLTMRKEKVPAEYEKLGYHDYTSASLHSKTRSSYGYYEVKAKPMDSGGSSSFWFHKEDTPGWVTEIDVFEIGGKAKGFERKYNMNLHVMETPNGKRHWDVQHTWIAPWRLADDYHVYGLDWNKAEIEYYVDGVVVRTVENTHWHQPLYLTFDSETMPEWFGMPDDKDLPSTFSIEYVRAWKKR
jgi:hypothetical protein